MMERKRPTKVVKMVKKDEPMNVAKKLVGKQMSHVLRGESDARVVRMSTYSKIQTQRNINLLSSHSPLQSKLYVKISSPKSVPKYSRTETVW